MRAAFVIAWLGASAAVAQAAEGVAPVPTVRLEEALAYARAHEPRIRAAVAELAARRSEARIPRARWLPRIGAALEVVGATSNNSSAVTLGVGELDLPRIGGTAGRTPETVAWTPAASTLAGVSLTQEVYDFGRIAAQTAVADAAATAAEADARARQLDTELGVELAYHGVLAARAALAAVEAAYRRGVTHRDAAEAGVASGLRPPVDRTRAQAEVAMLDVRRLRARAGVRIARTVLAATIGADAPELDAEPRPEDASESPTLDDVLQVAAHDDPAIAAARARVEGQRATTRAIGHELLPDLFASAGLSGRAGGSPTSNGVTPYGDGWLPDVANWHVGVVLAWRVFDGGTLARQAASRRREDVARAELDLATLAVRVGVRRGLLALETAREALPGLDDAVAASRTNQAQAEARFKAGLGTIVELADADELLTRAELERAAGALAVAQARAGLTRAIGRSTLQRTP